MSHKPKPCRLNETQRGTEARSKVGRLGSARLVLISHSLWKGTGCSLICLCSLLCLTKGHGNQAPAFTVLLLPDVRGLGAPSGTAVFCTCSLPACQPQAHSRKMIKSFCLHKHLSRHCSLNKFGNTMPNLYYSQTQDSSFPHVYSSPPHPAPTAAKNILAIYILDFYILYRKLCNLTNDFS